MKKIFIFSFVMLMLAVNVFAADAPELTVEEIENLIFKAEELQNYTNCTMLYGSDSYEGSYDRIQAIEAGKVEHIVTQYFYKGSYMDYNFYLVLLHPEYSYWQDIANSIYSKDIAEEMLLSQNTFIVYNNKIYMRHDPKQRDWYFVQKEMASNGEVLYDGTLDITIEERSDDTAIATFDYQDNTELVGKIKRATIELKYTENGWRISGGQYLDLIKNEGYSYKEFTIVSAPQTGVDAVAYTAVAVVALAAAAVVVKKKRA